MSAAGRSRVRPATPRDAPAIAALLCASRRAHLPYAPLAHGDAEVRAWVTEVLVPGGGVHVLEVDVEAEAEDPASLAPRIDAVLALSQTAEAGWIDQLYVRPGCTGRGLGERLLRLALERLAGPVRLYTFQANTGARRFYERHGFRAIAETDGACNEERCPDVLYERPPAASPPGSTGR